VRRGRADNDRTSENIQAELPTHRGSGVFICQLGSDPGHLSSDGKSRLCPDSFAGLGQHRGSVVTISRPLYYTPYTTSITVNGQTEPAGAKFNIITFSTVQAGFADLRIDGSQHDITASNILLLQGCLDCWVRNVETFDTGRNSNSAHVQLNFTYANEIRDSAESSDPKNGWELSRQRSESA
jgi:hypothetical protein